MKKSILTVLVLIALVVMASPFAPAAAQDNRTLTITEERINETYWVTNPANRRITDARVNLQEGQVTITAIYTAPTLHRPGTVRYTLSVTLVPEITNGRLAWRVTNASANGQPASAELLAQINAHLTTTWRRYIVAHIRPGALREVMITEADITFEYSV